MQRLNFKIAGMSCASCASTIEKTALKKGGAASAQVNFATETGSFDFEESIDLTTFKKVIESEGFKLHDDSQDGEEVDQLEWWRFTIAIILSMGLFVLDMTPWGMSMESSINWKLQFFLALPIWSWLGVDFLKALLHLFKTGRSNMNTLIGLGTTSAFLYSSVVTFFPVFAENFGLSLQVYFEAVGFIISFVLLGKIFESKAKKKAFRDMDSLYRLSAKKARVLSDNNEEREVDISEVKKKMIIRVKPGEKIPVDGVIVRGQTSIDESLVTGESIPVDKGINDSVISGTINGQGSIDFKVTKVGNETFLASVVSFVEKAQLSKAPIQRYADKVSSIFVPIVIIIAFVTFFMWYFYGPLPVWGNALSSMIAVLVIACPCALGLATPTAVVVATGKASKKGLLIGGGEVIEKGSQLDVIIFDKTGTITLGKPVVQDFHLASGFQKLEVLKLVAAVESFSEHPLSRAVINYAKSCGLSDDFGMPSSFEIVAGKGIVAEVEGKRVVLGNRSLVESEVVDSDIEVPEQFRGTFIFVSIDGKFSGVFSLEDEIKEGAKQAISSLKNQGVSCWMVTGDHDEVATRVGQEVGMDRVIAGVLPEDKLKIVRQIQKENKKVAMVGDGVNDAPALAQSDISLAMGSGTDVAIDASDVVLTNSEITKVSEFFSLSKGAMKVIRQNLFLAFIYNVLCIPLAAGLFYVIWKTPFPPVLASVAMGLSSISVVSNSLRLGWVK